MKKIIASIVCTPIAFFITRFVNAACDMRLAVLKAADPEFPHTAMQAVQKSLLDASLILPILAFSLCGAGVMMSIVSYICKREEEAKFRKESRK